MLSLSPGEQKTKRMQKDWCYCSKKERINVINKHYNIMNGDEERKERREERVRCVRLLK